MKNLRRVLVVMLLVAIIVISYENHKSTKLPIDADPRIMANEAYIEKE